MPSREELSASEERSAAQSLGVMAISEVKVRTPAKVSGLLQAVTYSPPTRTPSLVGTLFDGTGTIALVWLGRREIPGIAAGRRLQVAGMVTHTENGLTIMNPDYRLIDG